MTYCLYCHKEQPEDVKECTCGCRYFVYGTGFHLSENKVACDCGCVTMEKLLHLDYIDKAITNYSCSNCKNAIGTVSYRKMGG